jgi:DNA-binding MarR family transcriptional regulator
MRREKLKIVEPPAFLAEPRQFVLDEQLGFLLRVALQRMTAIFGTRMVEALTPAQFGALAKLYEAGPCSQNQLGRLICLDAATIKGVVDRLVMRGFVSSLSDPVDRRRRAVALTNRGRAVTEEALRAAVEIATVAATPLTGHEQQTLARLLKKLG